MVVQYTLPGFAQTPQHVAFQGGDDEANLLAEFYSTDKRQKSLRKLLLMNCKF